MGRKIINLYGKIGILFFVLGVLVIFHLRSDSTVKKPLEVILHNKNTSIVMYLVPFSVLTRIPITEDRMRNIFHSKIYIKSDSIHSVKNLLLTAHQKYLDDPPTNIRLLIDVLVDDDIVYTIPIAEGLEKEILEAFHGLLGFPL